MEELKKFTGQSMNLDKNDKSLLPTETREVYNSITDRKGVFTRIEGNTLVNFTLPAGDNKVIGWCNDYSRHAILYFVKNSLGNHCILRVRGNKIDKVLWVQSVLNFKGRINHANTIGDLLYWSDGFFESSTSYNPPRKINMIRAIGSNNPFSHSGLVYEKFDVVNNDGKVYEFIGDTPGVFPLSDTDNWQLKGRVYDNLTSERLYWILDRIKYPNYAQAPEVYYSDNLPAEPPIIIIDPPTTIPYGYLYNWDALFDVIPDVFELELIFYDIYMLYITDVTSVSDWNTFFNLPTNGTPFTSVEVTGNVVKLIGGMNIIVPDNLFNYGTNPFLLGLIDTGCIIGCGDFSFIGIYWTLPVIFPALVEVGEYCFYQSKFPDTLSLESLVTIGQLCFGYNTEIDNDIEFTLLVNIGNSGIANTIFKGDAYFPSLVNAMAGSIFSDTTFQGLARFPILENIGEYVFYNVESLDNSSLPLLRTGGYRCFMATTFIDDIYLPSLETIGDYGFNGAVFSGDIYLPSLLSLGTTVGLNNVFLGITGKTFTLTIPSALMTCNGGNPDGDIQYLQANNTVTIVTV